MKIIFIALFLFSMATPILAADCEIVCPPDTICLVNPLRACTLDDFLQGIVNFIFWMANVLAPVMIIIGAFYITTSAGNPERVNKGRKIILYALIGYAVVLLSKGLVMVIKSILGVS